jgi:hypothetical protein
MGAISKPATSSASKFPYRIRCRTSAQTRNTHIADLQYSYPQIYGRSCSSLHADLLSEVDSPRALIPSHAPPTHPHKSMRLLKYEEDGELNIISFDDRAVPPYAILSHTWGEDAEEVTFADLGHSHSKDKRGYKKIRFCGQQAQQDNLHYFWVDTCCIDKANKAEHSLAIQSMFRWYRNAARCYVYLSDVITSPHAAVEETSQPLWNSELRRSKWFTRGWTLQELLAPVSVEFFTKNWQKLGDKISLVQHIYEITGITHLALEGAPLSKFSVNERLRWKEGRNTKREEDGAYSLLGIFNVDLAPLYGEGAAGAFKRLMDEIHKLEKCIQDIRNTDSRDDKKRIEDMKGGLSKDSYGWILNNAEFKQWRNNPQSRLLCIIGNPGKGKTMLICGIINELQNTVAKSDLISYFFCQAADSRINSATAVLRGLLFLLVSQQPSLVSHVRKKYDYAGKTLFEDANAWFSLMEDFSEVLRDPTLNNTYLIIDALDECTTDSSKLIDFIAQQSSTSSRVKWIVSSRNWPSIMEKLERADQKVILSLELNSESVSAAVDVFIREKVFQLTQQKGYDKSTQDAVLGHLKSNANETFLWVALVCQDLQVTAKRNVLRKLVSFPPGLDALYKRMTQQINKTDDAELCKQVLALIMFVYRPITLRELGALLEQPQQVADHSDLLEIVSFCGSLLTVRNGTVYFVHESAKDFLVKHAAQEVFPSGKQAVHHAIFTQSLAVMSRTLHRDMYNLKAYGLSIDKIQPPVPDPLESSRYSCVYWIDHLYDSDLLSSMTYTEDLQDGGVVNMFLRKSFLHWLEALSLCKSIPHGIVSMAKLRSLVQVYIEQVTGQTFLMLTQIREQGGELP